MVDKNNHAPLYYQLKEDIKSKIQTEGWGPNSKIPSVREICEANNISTTTAKQAISELMHEGLLYSIQGKGTFVSLPFFSPAKWESTRISDEMRLATRIRSLGKEFSASLLTLDIVGSSAATANMLHIDPNAPAYRIRRLKRVDKAPMLIETTFIPTTLCKGLEKQDLSHSIFRILSENFGITLNRSEEALRPVFLNNDDALLIEQSPGSLALLNERVSYSGLPNPILFAKSIIRGDMCKLYVDLTNLRATKELTDEATSF